MTLQFQHLDMHKAKLVPSDGTLFCGQFAGRLFSTLGYVETLTVPSYADQILVMTYPL